MATIKDVANEAGVSVGSVSRYLNGYTLKKGNQEKVKEAIGKLKYVQNQTAKSLKMNKSFSIGVLIDTIDNFYSAQLIAQLEKIFDQHEYFLLLASHYNSEDLFERKLNKLLERSIDGLIVVKADPNWKSFKYLANVDMPVISLEIPLKNSHLPAVLSDDRGATVKVVEHLLKQCKQTAFIMPTKKDYVLEQRIGGIKAACQNMGYPLKNSQVRFADYGTKEAYEVTQKLVAEGFDSIFITNYSNALLSIRAIQDMGKKIGLDVRVGCFGYAHLFESLNVPITVIKQSVDQVALKTAQVLLALLEEITTSGEMECKILITNEISWQKGLKVE